MSYVVNGVVYSNVEDAFNQFIAELKKSLNTVIVKENKSGVVEERVIIENAKMVYKAKNWVVGFTPLKKQVMGYVIKNAENIKIADKELKKLFKKYNIAVDKLEYEEVLYRYYIINNSKFKSADIRVDLTHSLVEIIIDGISMNLINCTD